MQSLTSTTGGFTCDLYSPRLQQYFQDAYTTNNLQDYRQKLVARNNKSREVKLQLERMKQEYQQLKMQSEMHMQLMQMEQANAMSTSLAWTMSSWSAPPVRMQHLQQASEYGQTKVTYKQIDWRASNAQMNQGSQMAVQAAMVLDNMKLIEKEWAEYWE